MFTTIFNVLWKAMDRPQDWSIVVAYPGAELPNQAAFHKPSGTTWLCSHGFKFEILGDLDGLAEKERYLLHFKLKYKVMVWHARFQQQQSEVIVREVERRAAEKIRERFHRAKTEHRRHLHIVK